MKYASKDAIRADLRIDSVDQRVMFTAENLFEIDPKSDEPVIQLRLREGLVLNLPEVRIGDEWRLRFVDPNLVIENFDGTDWNVVETFTA